MSHRTQTAHVGASSTHVIDRESLQRSGDCAFSAAIGIAAAPTGDCARSGQHARQLLHWARTCTATPPPCCVTASTAIRPTKPTMQGSPASADTCAQPLSRPARPLPRALEPDSACCASLQRPAHCPRSSLHTALQPRHACACNCCQEETAGCHRHCCRDLEHAHGKTSAGRKVRGVQGTRAGDRGRTANDRIDDAQRRLAVMPTESMSTPVISMVTSDR